MSFRIAFMGASGTGKSKMATWLQERYSLPDNPVGSRSVSKAMGFDSPYDVDKVPGMRAQFQRRLLTEKLAWEEASEGFVSDRTILDSLIYTMFHDIYAVDEETLRLVAKGMQRYTHIIYCPVEAFCNPGGDTARVQDLTYHRLYDVTIRALFEKFRPMRSSFTTLHMSVFEDRQRAMAAVIG